MWRASLNIPKRTDKSIQNPGGSFKYVLRSVRYTIQCYLFCVLFISSSRIIILVTTLHASLHCNISLQGPKLSNDRTEGPRQWTVCWTQHLVLNNRTLARIPAYSSTCTHGELKIHLFYCYEVRTRTLLMHVSVRRMSQECSILIAVLVRSSWKNKTGRTSDKHGRDKIFSQNFCRKLRMEKTSWNTWIWT